jgi:hypothetical protein
MGKTARRIVVLLAACALVAPPAGASAAPGTGGTSAPATAPGLTATPNVLAGRYATFRGVLPARTAGRTVAIEGFDELSATWIALAGATVAADGSYVARWRADVTGVLQTRAVLRTDGARALAATEPSEATLTVYRPARASWYGPGLFGRRTACGQKLTRRLLGVAHRKLPCGTEVALTYKGRSITVPVVDRGPFRPGRRWDLTAATAKALGFTDTDRIGALRVG